MNITENFGLIMREVQLDEATAALLTLAHEHGYVTLCDLDRRALLGITANVCHRTPCVDLAIAMACGKGLGEYGFFTCGSIWWRSSFLARQP